MVDFGNCTTIKALARTSGVRAEALYAVIVTTPRLQFFGQELVELHTAIQEAAANFERLAEHNEKMFVQSQGRSSVFDLRAVRFRDYARKLYALEEEKNYGNQA